MFDSHNFKLIIKAKIKYSHKYCINLNIIYQFNLLKMRENKVLIQLWLNSITTVRENVCIGCQSRQNSQKYHSCLDDFFASDYIGMPYKYYQDAALVYMLEHFIISQAEYDSLQGSFSD